jgi:hypothetical protein
MRKLYKQDCRRIKKRNLPGGLGTYLEGDVVLRTPSKTDMNNTSRSRHKRTGTTNLQQIKFHAGTVEIGTNQR